MLPARAPEPLAQENFLGLVVVFFVFGIIGFAWMIVTMKRARTPIHNARTPTTLVDSGPVRFTRNPMYLCGSTCYAGLALVLVQLWSLVLLAAVVVTTHHGVVLRRAGLSRAPLR